MSVAGKRASTGGARARGELEMAVLAALGAAGKAMTPAEVLAGLGGDLAYTTVMTTLARLYAKGALERRQAGRAFEYCLVGNEKTVRANMVAHQMLKLLDEDGDRAGVLARFVAELSPQDEKLLAGLIESAGGAGGSDSTDGSGSAGAAVGRGSAP